MNALNRKFERNLVIVNSIWHFINGLVSIFFFGLDFKRNGEILLSQNYPELGAGSASLVDNIYVVLSTYGLLMILAGILNIIFLRYLKDNEINIKWQIWMVVLLVLSIFTMDMLSILGYSVLIAIYNSKNKSIRKFVIN